MADGVQVEVYPLATIRFSGTIEMDVEIKDDDPGIDDIDTIEHLSIELAQRLGVLLDDPDDDLKGDDRLLQSCRGLASQLADKIAAQPVESEAVVVA